MSVLSRTTSERVTSQKRHQGACDVTPPPPPPLHQPTTPTSECLSSLVCLDAAETRAAPWCGCAGNHVEEHLRGASLDSRFTKKQKTTTTTASSVIRSRVFKRKRDTKKEEEEEEEEEEDDVSTDDSGGFRTEASEFEVSSSSPEKPGLRGILKNKKRRRRSRSSSSQEYMTKAKTKSSTRWSSYSDTPTTTAATSLDEVLGPLTKVDSLESLHLASRNLALTPPPSDSGIAPSGSSREKSPVRPNGFIQGSSSNPRTGYGRGGLLPTFPECDLVIHVPPDPPIRTSASLNALTVKSLSESSLHQPPPPLPLSLYPFQLPQRPPSPPPTPSPPPPPPPPPPLPASPSQQPVPPKRSSSFLKSAQGRALLEAHGEARWPKNETEDDQDEAPPARAVKNQDTASKKLPPLILHSQELTHDLEQFEEHILAIKKALEDQLTWSASASPSSSSASCKESEVNGGEGGAEENKAKEDEEEEEKEVEVEEKEDEKEKKEVEEEKKEEDLLEGADDENGKDGSGVGKDDRGQVEVASAQDSPHPLPPSLPGHAPETASDSAPAELDSFLSGLGSAPNGLDPASFADVPPRNSDRSVTAPSWSEGAPPPRRPQRSLNPPPRFGKSSEIAYLYVHGPRARSLRRQQEDLSPSAVWATREVDSVATTSSFPPGLSSSVLPVPFGKRVLTGKVQKLTRRFEKSIVTGSNVNELKESSDEDDKRFSSFTTFDQSSWPSSATALRLLTLSHSGDIIQRGPSPHPAAFSLLVPSSAYIESSSEFEDIHRAKPCFIHGPSEGEEEVEEEGFGRDDSVAAAALPDLQTPPTNGQAPPTSSTTPPISSSSRRSASDTTDSKSRSLCFELLSSGEIALLPSLSTGLVARWNHVPENSLSRESDMENEGQVSSQAAKLQKTQEMVSDPNKENIKTPHPPTPTPGRQKTSSRVPRSPTAKFRARAEKEVTDCRSSRRGLSPEEHLVVVRLVVSLMAIPSQRFYSFEEYFLGRCVHLTRQESAPKTLIVDFGHSLAVSETEKATVLSETRLYAHKESNDLEVPHRDSTVESKQRSPETTITHLLTYSLMAVRQRSMATVLRETVNNSNKNRKPCKSIGGQPRKVGIKAANHQVSIKMDQSGVTRYKNFH
ncbi:uncharacterized protein LOC143028809 [Oratosquilla oratoria]|uniref:uncharacterized protein LOC143028809 n=1 Tax=Oratosquilla oratoria TaxID=337810 RepID=UPI003F75FA51